MGEYFCAIVRCDLFIFWPQKSCMHAPRRDIIFRGWQGHEFIARPVKWQLENWVKHEPHASCSSSETSWTDDCAREYFAVGLFFLSLGGWKRERRNVIFIFLDVRCPSSVMSTPTRVFSVHMCIFFLPAQFLNLIESIEVIRSPCEFVGGINHIYHTWMVPEGENVTGDRGKDFSAKLFC